MRVAYQMLKCIAYISTANTHFDTEMLTDLLRSCTVHNTNNAITGVLCYYNYSFLQFFEGQAPAVDSLFSRIEQDGRHKNVTKLFDQTISERAFPDFAMGLTNWDDLDAQQQAIFQDLNTVNLRAQAMQNEHSQAIDTFLFAFKKRRH